MKEELKRIGADPSDSDSEKDGDDEEAAPQQPRVYKSSDFVSTVTVMPIKTGSSSDEEEQEEEEDEAAEGGSGSDGEGGRWQQHAAQARQGWGQQRQGEQQQEGEQQQPQGRKLSKTALRIM